MNNYSRISMSEEVDAKVFDQETGKLLFDLEFVDFKTNMKGNDVQWDLEFFPDSYAAETWRELSQTDENKEKVYKILLTRGSLVRVAYGQIRYFSTNPCRFHGTEAPVLERKLG